MTGQFEQDFRHVFNELLAGITKAAERAVVEMIRSAFAEASEQAARALANPRGDAPSMEPLRRRRRSVPTEVATVPDRIVASIRANPGCDIAQLTRALGLNAVTLRRHVLKLADSGTIRIENGSVSRHGGPWIRTFFVVERSAAGRAEPSVVVAVATA